MKTAILKILLKMGIGITSSKNLIELRKNRDQLLFLRDLIDFERKLDNSSISPEIRIQIVKNFYDSKAQLHQDLFALAIKNFSCGGYFVEFGATDGLKFSNTHLLEKSFNWSGILAEPGRQWHRDLRENRNCIVETKCVWKVSGDKLLFNEVKVGELSTLDQFSKNDMHAKQREKGQRYEVETISLEDLLDLNQAPKFIDYLSIDTEGSEFEILYNFNFSKYSFGFITCEHNYSENRTKIFDLLTSNGYKRILENFSQFDDWFVLSTLETSDFEKH